MMYVECKLYVYLLFAALDQATNCGPPESIPNLPADARINGQRRTKRQTNPATYVPGAQVTIECDRQCHHYNSSTITCQPSGTWGPQIPSDIYCRRKSSYKIFLRFIFRVRFAISVVVVFSLSFGQALFLLS